MGILAVLLLLGSAIGGLVGLGGVEDEIEAAQNDRADGEDPEMRGSDLLAGTDGADEFSGGGGGDWLLGFDGDDSLSGDSGNDVLVGGIGTDAISGGTGDDFVESANVVDEALLRSSSASAEDAFGVEFAYDLPARSDEGDSVDLGDGDDTVVAGSDDTVTGGDGEDEFALGDWIEGDKPVEITDFDEVEDIITFVYDRDGVEPELSVETNKQTGVTKIMADGKAVAVLRDASPDFSIKNVAVGRYAA